MKAVKVKEILPRKAVVAHVAISPDAVYEFKYRPNEHRVEVYAQDEADAQRILNDLENRNLTILSIVRI